MFKIKFFKKNTHKETEQEREFVEKEVKKIPKVIAIIFFVYIVLFLSLMIWYFYFKSTYYISNVQGSSMKPLINTGIDDNDGKSSEDFVYVNKRNKGTYGDIVVAQITENGENKDIIKRIIAKEGDYVSVFVSDDGFYHVNIKYAGSDEIIKLEEDYIKSYYEWKNQGSFKQTKLDNGIFYEENFYSHCINNGHGYFENVKIVDGIYFYEVPKDSYYCMGDNRFVSKDSRYLGAIKKEKIKGVAEIIVKNGNVGGYTFFKKIAAISAFYWSKLENMFAR